MVTKDTYHSPVANEGELGNMIVVCNSEVRACEWLGNESGHKSHIRELSMDNHSDNNNQLQGNGQPLR